MERIRLTIKNIILTANSITGLLLFISGYSYLISPETSLLFSYLGLLFPVFLWINICFFIGWMLWGDWKSRGFSLVILLLSLNSILDYISINWCKTTNKEGDEKRLKIITYNVSVFDYGKKMDAIATYLNKQDADIICLQECYFTKDKTWSRLRRQLPQYRYANISFGIKRERNTGLAILSKYPIRKTQRVKLNSKFNGTALYEMNFEGEKLLIMNNHLESFKLTEKDKGMYADFVTQPGKEKLTSLSARLTSKLSPAFILRAQQADTLNQIIKRQKYDHMIVCGDFNDTPTSYTYHTIKDGFKDAFVESGNGFGVTFNKRFFWFRIDHILHTETLKPITTEVDRVYHSDHFPVISEFVVNSTKSKQE